MAVKGKPVVVNLGRHILFHKCPLEEEEEEEQEISDIGNKLIDQWKSVFPLLVLFI